jgi:hypothetical protein
MKKMVVIFLILIVFISIGESIWVPSHTKSESSTLKGGSSVASQSKAFSTSSDSGAESSGTSLPSNFDPFDYSNDQLVMSHWISPESMDNLLPNKSYIIQSDIKGIRNELRNVKIKEKIDENFRIESLASIPLVYNPFNESDYIYLTKDNYSIINNSVYIKVPLWKPLYRINYSYNINTPSRTGFSDIMTSIRIDKSSPKVLDYDFSQRILVKSPEFEVNVDVEKLNVDKNEPMNLTYYIKYKSPCSSETYPCTIKFETSSQYYLYLNYSSFKNNIVYKGQSVNDLINSDTYSLQDIIVTYKQTGSRHLPSIVVDGDYHTFDDQVIVEDLFKKIENSYPFWSLMLVFLSLVFYIIEIRQLIKRMKPDEQISVNTGYSRNQIASFISLSLSIIIVFYSILIYPVNNLYILSLLLALVIISAFAFIFSFEITK